MKINRLSLLNSLFNVLNENNQGDPYLILAEYFLEHYHELSRLNIYDVAADCFVSRSSIRRFCQAIGYENSSRLKMNSPSTTISGKLSEACRTGELPRNPDAGN